MEGRWINARNLMLKDPDLPSIPTAVITPWGADRVRANWTAVKNLGFDGVRIQLPFEELVGTNPTGALDPTDANKWNWEWTFRSAFASGLKVLLLFAYGPADLYDGWSAELDDLGYCSSNSFQNSRPPHGLSNFVWDQMANASIALLGSAVYYCEYYGLVPEDMIFWQFGNEPIKVTKTDGEPELTITADAAPGLEAILFSGSGWGAYGPSPTQRKFARIGGTASNRIAVRITAVDDGVLAVAALPRAVAIGEKINLLDWSDRADALPLDSLFWEMHDHIVGAIVSEYPALKYATPSIWGNVQPRDRFPFSTLKLADYAEYMHTVAETNELLAGASFLAANFYTASYQGRLSPLPFVTGTQMGIQSILEATERRWPLLLTECGLNSPNMSRGGSNPLPTEDYLRGKFLRAQQDFFVSNPDVFASCLYCSTSAVGAHDDEDSEEDWALVKYNADAKPSFGAYLGLPRNGVFPTGFANAGQLVSG